MSELSSKNSKPGELIDKCKENKRRKAKNLNERDKNIKTLAAKFFETQQCMTVYDFTIKNKSLMQKLYSKLEIIIIDIKKTRKWTTNEATDAESILIRLVIDKMNQKCKNFQVIADDLKIPEYIKTITNEIIPMTEDIMRKNEGELEKLEIFRKFVGHVLWCVSFIKNLQVVMNQNSNEEFMKLQLCAAEYFNSDVEIWLNLAEIEFLRKEYYQAEEILRKAIEYVPDSVKLWIRLIGIECKSFSIYSGQHIIEYALISFADNGFAINPYEWLEMAKKTYRKYGKKGIFDLTVTSLMGLGDKDEIEMCRKAHKLYNKYYLLRLTRFHHLNKRIWVEAIFQEYNLDNDLNLLFENACNDCPYDLNLRNLIQAKIKWKNKNFATAKRLFNIVRNDIGWKHAVAEVYRRFQKDLKKFREKKHEDFKLIIMINASDTKAVENVRSKIVLSDLKQYILDEWLYGKREILQDVLAKAVVIYEDSSLWIMKGQIEVKLGQINEAAETFKNGIEKSSEVDLHLQLADLEKNRGNYLVTRHVLKDGTSKYPNCFDSWDAAIRLEIYLKNEAEAKSLLTQALEKFPYSGRCWALAISMEEECKKRKKVSKALKLLRNKILNEDKHVMLEAAKYFFNQGDVDESRKRLNRAVEHNCSFNDAWIYFYKLEKLSGNEKGAREVFIRFLKLDALDKFSYGVEWERFRDDIDNWGMTKEELFEHIVKNLSI